MQVILNDPANLLQEESTTPKASPFTYRMSSYFYWLNRILRFLEFTLLRQLR